jgi:biopolymer transport protein ExbD
MGLLEKKKRRDVEIPTASMADIAFLLLIFFLVTTTIDVDTGIGMVLPPKLEEEVEPPPVRERNMFKILVNEEGRLLVEDQPLPVRQLRGEVVKHVMNCVPEYNYGCVAEFSESPDDAVVSIKTAQQTPYDSYIQVLDEVWMAYFEIWDNEARKRGYPSYEYYRNELQPGDENEIRELIKAQISLAEPDYE